MFGLKNASKCVFGLLPLTWNFMTSQKNTHCVKLHQFLEEKDYGLDEKVYRLPLVFWVHVFSRNVSVRIIDEEILFLIGRGA